MARLVAFLAVLAATTGMATVARAAPDPNPAYGNPATPGVTGALLRSDGLRNAQQALVLPQPDGKLLVAATAAAGTPPYDVPAAAKNRVVVIRLTSDGALDPSWGAGGRRFLGDALNCASCAEPTLGQLTLDSRGNVLVAVTVAAATDKPRLGRIARLTPAGALDTSFGGGDGIADLRDDYFDVFALGVAVDSRDRVLVATSTGPSPLFSIHQDLVRLTAAGTLDTAFAGDGSAPVSGITTVAVVPLPGDGAAIVGATKEYTKAPDGGQYYAGKGVVVRYDAAGSAGPQAVAAPQGAGSRRQSFVSDALALPDGTVLVAGSQDAQTNDNSMADPSATNVGAYVTRLPPGGGGPTTTVIPGTRGSYGTRLSGSPALGYRMLSTDTTVNRQILVGLNGASLALDAGFGSGGILRFPGFRGPGTDAASDVAVDAAQGVAVAGQRTIAGAAATDRDLAVLRLGPKPTSSAGSPVAASPVNGGKPGGGGTTGGGTTGGSGGTSDKTSAPGSSPDSRGSGGSGVLRLKGTTKLKVVKGRITLRLRCGSGQCGRTLVRVLSRGKKSSVYGSCTVRAKATSCKLLLSNKVRRALRKGRVRAKLRIGSGRSVAVTLRR